MRARGLQETAGIGICCRPGALTGRVFKRAFREFVFIFNPRPARPGIWAVAPATFSGKAPLVGRAARALNLADTTPTTLPRSSTNAPPELPGCTGTLIWKYRASSPAPDSDGAEMQNDE